MNKRTCISFQTMGLVRPNKSTKMAELFDSRILLNQPFFRWQLANDERGGGRMVKYLHPLIVQF